jgi:hypothetical protein
MFEHHFIPTNGIQLHVVTAGPENGPFWADWHQVRTRVRGRTARPKLDRAIAISKRCSFSLPTPPDAVKIPIWRLKIIV